MSDEQLTIGRLAGQLGLNPRTIRYYERIGLLPEPERTGGGYRLYGSSDAERLQFIRSAQRLGLSLGEIHEVLAFRERGEQPCRYVASVIDERLGAVNQQLRELRAFKRELTELRERMRADGPADHDGSYCHYIAGAEGRPGRPDEPISSRGPISAPPARSGR